MLAMIVWLSVVPPLPLFALSLILEGGELNRYKKNLVNRYEAVADKGLSLCLGGSPWEWNRGEGYTMDLSWERKVDLVALLSNRSFVKVARFVRAFSSSMHGKNLQRPSWTISSSTRSIGWERRVAATLRFVRPHSSHESSTLSHFRPPTGAST